MKISSFGEVLWDDFPTGKVLGGAPLNVAVRLRMLGADATIISCCGNDAYGEQLRQQVQDCHLSTKFIYIHPEQATSLVKISLDDTGSARYEIVYPCAWDKITLSQEAIAHVAQSDVLVYGSLITRDEHSRTALSQLLKVAKFKVFDVNLRAPHYDVDRIGQMMEQADLVKLNDDEFYELCAAHGSPYHSIEQNLDFLAELTHTKQLCVTMGSHGAVYYCDGQVFAHQGFRVKVADTVGAGDSFLAGFIFQLQQNAHPKDALTFACALGALAATQQGATGIITLDDVQTFINPH